MKRDSTLASLVYVYLQVHAATMNIITHECLIPGNYALDVYGICMLINTGVILISID